MKSDPFLLINSIITLFFLFFCFPTSYSEDVERYTICSRPFSCGKSQNLSYPFWKENGRPAYCGIDERFKLRNCEHSDQFPIMSIGDEDYHVINLNQSGYVMTIARLDYWMNVCPTEYKNTTLDRRFQLTPTASDNISLFYNCDDDLDLTRPYRLPCHPQQFSFYASSVLLRELKIENPECSQKVDIPVPVDFLNQIKSWNEIPSGLSEVLRKGFDVLYMYEFYQECMLCTGSGGMCGHNTNTSEFTCYCRDGVCPISKENGSSGRFKLIIGRFKLIIGTGTLAITGILISSCIVIYHFKKRNIKRRNQDFEAFLKNHGPVPVKRYSFSQVKKMTNSFKENLGKGGYGTVYKGKLFDDDRFVAVKILNSSKGEGEEFINEVASISRTSHVNIVTLLGFCLEGDKKVLIYEFMPNGSLDRYISNASVLKVKNDHHLEWKTIHQIAIGIARGLDYLHQRCNTRIVHFDIKPQNILLDENYWPKISDFGLAKLCVRRESTISMLDTRGTIGYIAPEVFSRNFGKVSYKSDVYSYGMMVLEMIGGKTKDTDETDSTSETYFPNWIYKRLEAENISELHGEIMSTEESEIVRKMSIIGLWCIQTNPSDRPSMSSVLEMLQGSIDVLTIPPTPFLSSLPKSPPLCSVDSSITIE